MKAGSFQDNQPLPLARRKLRTALVLAGIQAAYLASQAIAAPTVAEAASKLFPKQTQGPALKIRVRLSEALPVVQIRGFDLKFHEQGMRLQGQRRLASISNRSTRWQLHCSKGRVQAIPLDPSAGTLQPVVVQQPLSIESPAGMLQVQGRRYRDSLQVYASTSQPGHCEVINVVGIEEYLGGLVNAEFSSRWSEEAVAAQVIAARTYALHQIQRAAERPAQRYDVDSTIKDQVYDGYEKEDYQGSRIVERTRGMVLMNQGQPLKAFYHSTCGGQTELPERVWGKSYGGFKKTVSCPYCGSSPAFRWTTEVSARELKDLLLASPQIEQEARKIWPADWKRLVRAGNLLDLRVQKLQRANDRVEELALVFSRPERPGQWTTLKISAPRLRGILGPGRVKSTWFDVIPVSAASSQWRLQGRGNGHGVGLCQWGAKVMGERGHSMGQILTHYYPDAKLRKLW